MSRSALRISPRTRIALPVIALGISAALLCAAAIGGCRSAEHKSAHAQTESAESAEAPAPRIERDLVYSAARSGQAPLLLDLYHPPESAESAESIASSFFGTASQPAVVLIHGGSWQRGNRERMARNAEAIARAGFVVANIEYSLAPDYQFPAPLEDCRTAVRWLRQNASNYDIDAERIGAFGFSAGGHLALLLATTDGEAGAADSSAIQAVVAGAPPVDLYAFPENSAMRRLLGVRRKEAPELYRKASPINHISANDPPTFLYHGRYDWLVPVAQSRRMAAGLEAAGVTVKLLETKQGHQPAAPDNAEGLGRAIAFLKEHLGD